MGKLAPERFEVVFLYKNRRGFFFGNKILGWIDHLSPGARNPPKSAIKNLEIPGTFGAG